MYNKAINLSEHIRTGAVKWVVITAESIYALNLKTSQEPFLGRWGLLLTDPTCVSVKYSSALSTGLLTSSTCNTYFLHQTGHQMTLLFEKFMNE